MKLKAFAEWLYGPFSDTYTWLIWACVIGIFATTGWRLAVVFVVEVITVAMRIWTRDVRAEQVKRKQKEVR